MELEIQVLVLIRLLAWLFAALTCVLLALAFGIVALIVALWDTHRTLGLLAGSGVFVGLGLLLGYLGLRSVRNRPARSPIRCSSWPRTSGASDGAP